jgi:hypothetical protein
MKWLGMQDRETTRREQKTCVCDPHALLNRFGGICSTAAEVEDEVTTDALVGTVSDPCLQGSKKRFEHLSQVSSPTCGVPESSNPQCWPPAWEKS